MNAHVLALWTKGFAKVEAGRVDDLTEAEREVVAYIGGAALLKPKPRVRLSVKRDRVYVPPPGGLEHADMVGKLEFMDVPGTLHVTGSGTSRKLSFEPE